MTEKEQQDQSAGYQLGEERKRQKLSREAVAAQLNLSAQTIDMLESDDFDNLPPPTFARGYLRAYAKLLGVDVGNLMLVYNEYAPADPELMPANHVTKDAQSNHPVVRWATLSIVVAIFTLLGFWWIGPRYINDNTSEIETLSDQSDSDGRMEISPSPEIAEPLPETVGTDQVKEAPEQHGVEQNVGEQSLIAEENNPIDKPVFVQNEEIQIDQDSEPDETDSGQTQQRSEPPIGFLPEPDEVETASTIAIAADAGSETGQSSETSSEPDGTAESSETVVVVEDTVIDDATTTAIEPEAIEAIILGDDELNIQTEGETWVEVVDANGVRLVYDMLTQDRRLNLRGTAPFKVFLGNTPGISMTMNGITIETPSYNSISKTSRFYIDTDGSQSRKEPVRE